MSNVHITKYITSVAYSTTMGRNVFGIPETKHAHAVGRKVFGISYLLKFLLTHMFNYKTHIMYHVTAIT